MFSIASVIARARSSFCCWLRPAYISTLTIGITVVCGERRRLLKKVTVVREWLSSFPELLYDPRRGDQPHHDAYGKTVHIVQEDGKDCRGDSSDRVSQESSIPR